MADVTALAMLFLSLKTSKQSAFIQVFQDWELTEKTFGFYDMFQPSARNTEIHPNLKGGVCISNISKSSSKL